MEEFSYKKMNEMDGRYNDDSIVLLKALALFLPSDKQSGLILFVKFMEIRHILQYMKRPAEYQPAMPFDNYQQVFSEIKPSLSEPTARKIEQILNMVSAFRMFQQMKDLMEVMGPMMSADGAAEGTDAGDSSGAGFGQGMNMDMLEMFKTMMPAENQQLFDLFMQMKE